MFGNLTFPTGTPPCATHTSLATRRSGTKVFQGAVGLTVEQVFGSPLLSCTCSVARPSELAAHRLREQLATKHATSLAAVYGFDEAPALGVVLSYQAEGDAAIGGFARLVDRRLEVTETHGFPSRSAL